MLAPEALLQAGDKTLSSSCDGDVYLFGPNWNKRFIDWGWVPD